MPIFSLEPDTAYSDAARGDVVESRGETTARCVAEWRFAFARLGNPAVDGVTVPWGNGSAHHSVAYSSFDVT